ncbi:MAG: glycosyltransferase family 2 protein [Anaerolineae bacterium]|nr:MAG: glycosyltransferase family 2 protein [Anaerolineae bacterium]
MGREHVHFRKHAIAIVVPAYNVERHIAEVLRGLPGYVRHVIVVDDASKDGTAEVVAAVAARDRRVVLLRHTKNQGVGGAMVTGFRKALELGADVVVKIDGDGQMDPSYLPDLLTPLLLGEADYTKGNRFRDFQALRQMPWIRRLGNMALSFAAKAATGYWNCFDPTNGFLAIRSEVLRQLPLERIDHSYYFETSMLSYLYLVGACVRDVPIPARYGDETSNISIRRVLMTFPLKLLRTFLRRIVLKNYLYDFNMESVFLLAGLPLLLFGLIFGSYKWAYYAGLGIPAPTGTVMLPTLSVILGIQFLLSAISIDLQSVPTKPLSPPLEERHR